MKHLFLTTLLILLSIFGYSQSNGPLGALPFKFKSFTAKKIDKNTIQVFFEVEGDSDITSYLVWLSFDGIKYEPRKWICPNGLKENKKYYVNLKINE